MARPTAENLDSLKRHLKRLVADEQDRGQATGIEKRRHTRHLYMVEAHITCVKRFSQVGDRPAEFVVYTKDLSRSGLSFLHEHEMYAGEVIEVGIKLRGGQSRTYLVRIARCRRAGLKVFNIAGVFINPDEVDEPAPGL